MLFRKHRMIFWLIIFSEIWKSKCDPRKHSFRYCSILVSCTAPVLRVRSQFIHLWKQEAFHSNLLINLLHVLLPIQDSHGLLPRKIPIEISVKQFTFSLMRAFKRGGKIIFDGVVNQRRSRRYFFKQMFCSIYMFSTDDSSDGIIKVFPIAASKIPLFLLLTLFCMGSQQQVIMEVFNDCETSCLKSVDILFWCCYIFTRFVTMTLWIFLVSQDIPFSDLWLLFLIFCQLQLEQDY